MAEGRSHDLQFAPDGVNVAVNQEGAPSVQPTISVSTTRDARGQEQVEISEITGQFDNVQVGERSNILYRKVSEGGEDVSVYGTRPPTSVTTKDNLHYTIDSPQGVVQIGKYCVEVRVNFSNALVRRLLDEGHVSVRLQSSDTLVDIHWSNLEKKEGIRSKIKVKPKTSLEESRDSFEQDAIRLLLDNSNDYLQLCTLVKRLYNMFGAMLRKITGGCLELWIMHDCKEQLDEMKRRKPEVENELTDLLYLHSVRDVHDEHRVCIEFQEDLSHQPERTDEPTHNLKIGFPTMATGGYSKPKGHVQFRCDSCQQAGEEKDAEYYCEECQEYLCNDCKEAHGKVSLTRGHEVTKVCAVSGTTSVMFSSDDIHDCEPCKTDGYDKEASHYCGICKEHLCGACGLSHGKFKVSKDHVLTKLHVPTPMSQTVSSQNNQDVILDLSPQSISKVNVKVANDMYVPKITGCTFLSSGELLLCNHQNKNIELLDKSLTVSDSIKVASKPWDVAILNDETAIVTLPVEKKIQYVDLVPKLSIGSKISTKQRCWGIVVVNKFIYITCHGVKYDNTGGYICVLDLRGNELKKVGINRDGSQFLQGPYYIAVNREGNKLYVTDFHTNEIICISPSGNIIYKLKDSDIYAPRGVYVDSQDNLVVCSAGNDTVQVIAANGTKYKTLLVSNDGVRDPLAIAFRPTDSTLIVGLDGNNEDLAVKLA